MIALTVTLFLALCLAGWYVYCLAQDNEHLAGELRAAQVDQGDWRAAYTQKCDELVAVRASRDTLLARCQVAEANHGKARDAQEQAEGDARFFKKISDNRQIKIDLLREHLARAQAKLVKLEKKVSRNPTRKKLGQKSRKSKG